jgi:transcriptional regulator with XRE-family HTH domain
MRNLRLSDLRKKKGVTQEEVSAYLKITNKTYSTYETGRNQMNYETLCLLADYFEVSTDYLLGRQDAVPSFLSEEERELINDYRTLDERGKLSVQSNISFEATQNRSCGAAKNRQCDLTRFS